MQRPASYYRVAGIDLRAEMDRLRSLEVFAGGRLALKAPELKVRRARRRPNRLGFAVPVEYRLSVTAYPGIRAGDILETLLHELVHLHVGRQPCAHAWHGRTFKLVLAAAMAEAYQVGGRPPRSTVHGAYAEAIERRLDQRGEQLELAAASNRYALRHPLTPGSVPGAVTHAIPWNNPSRSEARARRPGR